MNAGLILYKDNGKIVARQIHHILFTVLTLRPDKPPNTVYSFNAHKMQIAISNTARFSLDGQGENGVCRGVPDSFISLGYLLPRARTGYPPCPCSWQGNPSRALPSFP
jgi:hypothetical protein